VLQSPTSHHHQEHLRSFLPPRQEAPWVFLVVMAVGEARCWV